MDITRTVAQNVKRVREQNKLTLDAAATITGVSRSMLAQIERGDVNPTISVLWKIANGFKVSFSTLIETTQERPTIVRAAQTIPILECDGHYRNYPVFTFDDDRLFETYRIVIDPFGFLEAQPHLPGSQEYITVFSGSVEITTEGECFSLSEGDSIHFQADLPHSYKNIGACEVKLSMLICYSG